MSRHSGVHVELEVVVHLWVDLDPSAPPAAGPTEQATEASIIGGQMRGVPLGVEALEAIAAAYQHEVLALARDEMAHRDQMALPL